MADHAILSASGAHRWLACTPSARFEMKFPASTSAYAEEGTVAHSVAELTTRYYLGEIDENTYNCTNPLQIIMCKQVGGSDTCQYEIFKVP